MIIKFANCTLSKKLTAGSHDDGDDGDANDAKLTFQALIDDKAKEAVNRYWTSPDHEPPIPMSPFRHLDGLGSPEGNARVSLGAGKDALELDGSMQDVRIKRIRNKGPYFRFRLAVQGADADRYLLWRAETPGDWEGAVKLRLEETLFDRRDTPETGNEEQLELKEAA